MTGTQTHSMDATRHVNLRLAGRMREESSLRFAETTTKSRENSVKEELSSLTRVLLTVSQKEMVGLVLERHHKS